jgi:hypothetical protein
VIGSVVGLGAIVLGAIVAVGPEDDDERLSLALRAVDGRVLSAGGLASSHVGATSAPLFLGASF